MGERVTVEGTVENVIFHNEENGYTVLLLTVEGEEEPVTVVGCIPSPACGTSTPSTAASSPPRAWSAGCRSVRRT